VAASPLDAAAQTGGLAVAPAQNPGGVKRSSFDFVVAPGAVQDDAVTVSNLSDEKKAFFVYVANGFTTETGKIGVRPDDAAKTGPVLWLKFGRDLPDGQIVLEPKTAAVIPFRITIPADAQPGDYAFGIAASPPIVRPTATPGQNNTKVIEAVATAVLLRVQGPLQPSVQIGSLKVNPTAPLVPFLFSGETEVRAEIVNDGNVRLPTTVVITEEDMFGNTIHTEAPIQLDSLLPGASVTVRARWHKTPLIKGKIVVNVTTDGGHGTGATRSKGFWVIPWKFIALVVLAILAAIYLRRRRRKKTEPADVGGGPLPRRDLVGSGVR
jgi:hypothetical protein